MTRLFVCPRCRGRLEAMWDEHADPMVAWRCDYCRKLWHIDASNFRELDWPERGAYYGHSPRRREP